jgi:hypothetical protein
VNEQRVKLAINQAVRQRNYRRARDRALVRLANLYPDLYKDLLKEEKENDKALNKQWIDLDGSPRDRDNLHSGISNQGTGNQEANTVYTRSDSDS